MYRVSAIVLTLVLGSILLAQAVPAFAGCNGCDEGLNINANVRWRSEADGKDFNGDTDMALSSSMRARLGFSYFQNNVGGVFQLQYPHTLGWNSGALNTDVNLDVHQAYLDICNLCLDGLSFRVGRTELSYGDQRLVGPVGWSDIGRVFDGMIFSYSKEDKFWADLFFTKQAERSNANPDPTVPGEGFEKDDLFFGFWGMHVPSKINVFFLHNRNAGQATDSAWVTSLSRSTFGVHYWNNFKDPGLKALFDFAYQTGTRKNLTVSPVGETDIAAWMVLFGLWYNLDVGPLESIGAGIDMVSGDDDATDDKINNFDNLYYTGHKWRGYMDYFITSDTTGLNDIFFNLKVKCLLMENTYWKLAFHNFTTGVDYASVVDSSKTNALGNEIDLVLTRKIRSNLTCQAGLGYFMPSEDWKGNNADNALWAFLQLHAKFGKSCSK